MSPILVVFTAEWNIYGMVSVVAHVPELPIAVGIIVFSVSGFPIGLFISHGYWKPVAKERIF